ncbi:response regulator [Rhodobacteraceae bacterium CCMM004]|nr:response regulator [Rhodobacteraceae bacterium CCMM004]
MNNLYRARFGETLPKEALDTPSPCRSTHWKRSQTKGKTGLRILILEDEVLVALDLESELQSMGVEDVDLAHTLETAHRLCDQHAYTHAFLDWNLGDSDSSEIIERLRATGCQLVLITGYDLRPEFLEAMGALHMSKPFRRSAIGAVLAAGGTART